MFGHQAILPIEVSSSKKEDAIANTTGEENKDRIIDDHLSYQSKKIGEFDYNSLEHTSGYSPEFVPVHG